MVLLPKILPAGLEQISVRMLVDESSAPEWMSVLQSPLATLREMERTIEKVEAVVRVIPEWTLN